MIDKVMKLTGCVGMERDTNDGEKNTRWGCEVLRMHSIACDW
jgi:hypothetical protein